MRLFILLLLLPTLAFADNTPFVPLRDEPEWLMRIKTFESVKRLIETCETMGAKVNRNEGGCTRFETYTDGTKICTIYVRALKDSEDRAEMGLWGHELAHCKYGAYHSVD